MPRLTLTRRVVFVTLASVALLVLLGATLVRDLRSLRTLVDSDLVRRIQLDRSSDQMEIATLEVGVAAMRVLLRNRPEDRERAALAEADLGRVLGRYDSLTASSPERPDYDRLAPETEAFRRFGRDLVERASGRSDLPAPTPASRAVLDSMIAHREALDRLLDTDIQVRSAAAVAETRLVAASLSGGLQRLIVAGGQVALAAPLLLVGGVHRAVVRPAQALSATVAGVAGGDFTAHADLTRAGDLTALAGGINAMTDRLRLLTSENERLAEVGLLAAGVAHEVRNPLFGISSNLDAWQVSRRDEAASVELAEQIRHEVRRLTDLMRDLMNYGRPAPVALAEQSLEGPVRAALAELQSMAERKGVALRTSLPSPAPAALVDAGRLQQAIENVVRNAVAFTPEGGLVELAIDQRPAATAIVIADGGPGFPPAELDRVFRPFHSRRPGGTGLGLAIVSRIMRDMGGRAVASNGPRGGVVTLELPAPGARA